MICGALIFILMCSALTTGNAYDGDSPIARLQDRIWSGSIFFTDCYFQFELETDNSGTMYLSDEFGVKAVSKIRILADNRFVDEDNQDFTMTPAGDGYTLNSTHLPPITIQPLTVQPQQPPPLPLEFIYLPVLPALLIVGWVVAVR